MLNTEARQQLRSLLPPGMLATKQWLIARGLNPHFVDNAVRSKTLQPLAAGVFTLFSENMSWEGVVASLQRMAPSPLHVGGLSALEIVGLAQYLSRSEKRRVHLYSVDPLPRWLSRLPLNVQFEAHRTKALWPDAVMSDPSYVKQEQWREGLPPMLFSGPEKAILEVLADVPRAISFEHADELMQGLYNLSPRKVDTLLLACVSVKVKRLFLWLAERHNHAWMKKLDTDKYDLGSGKRVIATEGRLDKTWLITVPRNM
jgi:hypothetical protein